MAMARTISKVGRCPFLRVPEHITPLGHQRLKDELLFLLDKDRPAVGRRLLGREERRPQRNADYQYGKRLREIDKRDPLSSKRWTTPKWWTHRAAR